MTPHEAMAAWGVVIQEYRRACDLADAAKTRACQLGGSVRAYEEADAAASAAFANACGAQTVARCAYEAGAPSGAVQMLIQRADLAGDNGMYDVDVAAIEAIIAAVFAPPAGPTP